MRFTTRIGLKLKEKKITGIVVEMHRAGAFQPALFGFLFSARCPECLHPLRLLFAGSGAHGCALPAFASGLARRAKRPRPQRPSLSRTSTALGGTLQRLNRPGEPVAFRNQKSNDVFCLHQCDTNIVNNLAASIKSRYLHATVQDARL